MSLDPPVVILVASEFEVRGSSFYTLRLAEQLPALGFKPLVVSPNSERVPESSHSQIEFLDYAFLDTPVLGKLVAAIVARDLQKHEPVLVHVQSRQAIGVGQLIARQLKCPSLVTIHHLAERHERLKLDRSSTAGVIAVSEFVRDGLLPISGLSDDNVHLVYSGVKIPPESELVDVLNPDRVPVIGTAGPLERSKGIEFFLIAAKDVLRRGHKAEFLIAGSGPDEARLRELTRTLEIGQHVTFVTNLLDFSSSLQAMDVFCLPSLSQGLGTIMLKAMALGRPVIATEVGGVAKIVRDGQTGLSIPPSDSGRLGDRMLELLSNPIRARMIGQTAREFVIRDFNVDRMVSETVGVYRRVLGQ